MRAARTEDRIREHAEEAGLVRSTGKMLLQGLLVEAAGGQGQTLTPQKMAIAARDEQVRAGIDLGRKLIMDGMKGDRISHDLPAGGPDAGTTVNVTASAQAAAQANASAVATVLPVAATMREFVERDLGPAAIDPAGIYPRIAWIVDRADRPDVKTVILQLGKGSGKAWVIALLLVRTLQRLLCHPDPAAAIDLMPGTKVGVLNASVTGMQAQMAVFDIISRFVSRSPWFAQFAPKILSDRIEFVSKNVVALSGNSSSKGVEGTAWVACGADELSRLPEDEHQGPRQARDLVEPIEDTMLSRSSAKFATVRKAVLASWPEHRDDYIESRVARARKAGIAVDLTAEFRACAIALDPSVDSTRRHSIAQAPFSGYASECFLSVDGTLCVVAPSWECKPDGDLVELASKATTAEYDFARRFGAYPLMTGETPFFRDIVEFERRAIPRPDPVGSDGRFLDWFKGDPNEWYFGHIDLGVRHDAAGIAVAHYNEGRVIYDLLLEIKPPDGGELRIGALLDIFADMRSRGFEFMKVTRDGYQGIAVGQDLESRGITTEEFSVDRNRAAYDTFKGAFLAGQLDYYASAPLFECVRSLVDVGKKVDHAPGGKKDLADAAAAVCYHALESVT